MIRLRSLRALHGGNVVASDSVLRGVLELADGTQPAVAPSLPEQALARCARIVAAISDRLTLDVDSATPSCVAVLHRIGRGIQELCGEPGQLEYRPGFGLPPWQVAFGFRDEELSRQAIGLAVKIVRTACSDAPFGGAILRLREDLAALQATAKAHRDAADTDRAAARPQAAIVVCAIEDAAALSAEIARALRAALHWRLGVANVGGVVLDGQEGPAEPEPVPLHRARTRIAAEPTVDAGIYAMHPRNIHDRGLGLRHADIAVIGVSCATYFDKRRKAQIRAVLASAGARIVDDAGDHAATAKAVVDAAARLVRA